MPYDSAKDPWQGVSVSPVSLGRIGRAVTPDDAADLGRYARLRVFAPNSVANPSVAILPVENADGAPLVLPLPAGQASILPYLVRRVLATGTSIGLVIHTID
ncbi:hypothetical protein MWN34_05360 [Ancylobacter sp. 6x-1]|uniref:Uncharacterized protein n=1 Tax=Ancylobacter crimeensis TaxID=2579147 RepID=A0ABT0D8R1_9HYPH|nr:hypothetical protein [Ancylobacter crimeensis]MCK0196338.1 hypothetical protein [Ancylobacter crimeensis]